MNDINAMILIMQFIIVIHCLNLLNVPIITALRDISHYTLSLKQRRYVLFAVHLKASLVETNRRDEILLRQLPRISTEPLTVAGDFNFTTHMSGIRLKQVPAMMNFIDRSISQSNCGHITIPYQSTRLTSRGGQQVE